MFSKLLVAMAVAIVAVNAQGSSTASAPSTTPSLSPCVAACLTLAATANGCSFTNVTCVCTNTQFQADFNSCLGSNCSPTDVQAALALQTAECAAAGIAPTGPGATPSSLAFVPPSTSPSIATSSSIAAATVTVTATPTATATPTSVAATSNPGAIAGGVIGGIAFVGIVTFLFLLLRGRKRPAPTPITYSAVTALSQPGRDSP